MDIKVNGRTPEERIKSYHKIHYEWIDKAIIADEANDIEMAVQYYIKGLELTNMCLHENVVGNSHSQIKAREIQEKMKKNRNTEIERLEYLLSSKLKSDRKLSKSSSVELDDIDFGKSKIFNKSFRDKKGKKESKEDGNKGMGNRSNSASNINKIKDNNPPGESNLAKALQTLNSSSNNKPSTTSPSPISRPGATRNTPTSRVTPRTNQGPVTNRNRMNSGPPRPKLSVSNESPSAGDQRNINKDNILSKLKNVDRQCIETILNEVLDSKTIKFEDIAGNEVAKQCLLETVIYPKLRPELFTGLRSPAKGILLFGPPGNGKTLLAKAVANESKCVFFNISAASLMSKWVGEGEKLVRALFAVAKHVAPSVIFLDEVDSLLSARGSSDDKSHTRRILTQFLQEIDGAGSGGDELVLCMAATNRPDELDDAALRRFQKKIYIKMPDNNGRKLLLKKLLTNQANRIKDSDFDKLVELTKGYSCSDLTNLAKSAAMIPIRELPFEKICSVTVESMRPIKYSDFAAALRQIKPSVPIQSLSRYEKWNELYGDNTV